MKQALIDWGPVSIGWLSSLTMIAGAFIPNNSLRLSVVGGGVVGFIVSVTLIAIKGAWWD